MKFRMTYYSSLFRWVVKGLLGTVFGIQVDSLDEEVCPSSYEAAVATLMMYQDSRV
jgi:hypothetical protein